MYTYIFSIRGDPLALVLALVLVCYPGGPGLLLLLLIIIIINMIIMMSTRAGSWKWESGISFILAIFYPPSSCISERIIIIIIIMIMNLNNF